MKRTLFIFLALISTTIFAQKLAIQTLLKDKISIRALQIWDGKVWYSGTDSKFGYVSLKDSSDRKQLKLSTQKLQFRTLAQNRKSFYLASIESPAQFFKIDKKTLTYQLVKIDSAKNAFYDAIYHHKNTFYAFSDPEENLEFKMPRFYEKNEVFNFHLLTSNDVLLNPGEAAFAASNTNISARGNFLWLATGGHSSRIWRLNIKRDQWEIFNTPFIQGTSAQGIYSIDFYDQNFGAAVGGDYTKQDANINNIATTHDGGKSWQIRASGKNGGYKTCVKIRPGSKGKDLIAVGDQNIEFSRDYGKSWTKISDEKNLYVCDWIDRNTLVFAGKDRIVKMKLY